MTEAANCALSISMPTDEITIFILLTLQRYEKVSYHKTFRPKNAAKIENYFGQTSVLTPYLPSDEQCSIQLAICPKTLTMVYSIQYTVFFRRGKKTEREILLYIYIYKYIYIIIYITCVMKNEGVSQN